MNYTPEQLAKVAHISDAEMRQGIAETLAEIHILRSIANGIAEDIGAREQLIAKIEDILEARGASV
jgi:hypothetical protein